MEDQFDHQVEDQPYNEQNPPQNFEHQNQEEPQTQSEDEAPLNKSQVDAQYENQNDSEGNDYVEPMVGQNPSLTNSNNSSNVTEQTFSMQKSILYCSNCALCCIL